jgi:hypothetical protein
MLPVRPQALCSQKQQWHPSSSSSSRCQLQSKVKMHRLTTLASLTLQGACCLAVPAVASSCWHQNPQTAQQQQPHQQQQGMWWTVKESWVLLLPSCRGCSNGRPSCPSLHRELHLELWQMQLGWAASPGRVQGRQQERQQQQAQQQVLVVCCAACLLLRQLLGLG